MAISLVTEFKPHVDELFTTGSKKSLLTNNDFDWTGAHTVKVYKVSTSKMNDYNRNPAEGFSGSRYGSVEDLDATTEEFTLSKDRSFTFAIDKLDSDETKQQVEAANALARQQREVIIPEVDQHVYKVMCENAGTKLSAVLTSENIYDEIIKANAVLDDAEVPDTERYLVVVPETLLLMKKNPLIESNSDIGQELRVKGVVSTLDGMNVVKVPANRVPDNFGFLLCHPVATVAPTKLEDYKIHEDPPGISGDLVEGRIVYDAFVLDNKKMAIYYEENSSSSQLNEI